MTLPEAQARLTTLVLKIVPGLSGDEVLEIQTKIVDLVAAVPTSVEFKPIRDAARELMPVLVEGVTQSVIADLDSRTAILDAVTAHLARTAEEAQARARGLTLAQPAAIADALKNVVTAVQDVRKTAASGDVVQALQKAQGLQALLTRVQTALKG